MYGMHAWFYLLQMSTLFEKAVCMHYYVFGVDHAKSKARLSDYYRHWQALVIMEGIVGRMQITRVLSCCSVIQLAEQS